MAEFLIMARKHWLFKDKMSPEELIKYDKQFQPGDIVQVYPDGTCKEPCANPAFYIVKVKGLDYKDALKYTEVEEVSSVEKSSDIQPDIIKRRKYSFNFLGLPTAKKEDLLLKKTVEDIAFKDAECLLINKTLSKELS